jgi:hypothetical protein
MANRIKLLCLGATQAPYSTSSFNIPGYPGLPPILTGVVSESFSFDVSQMQIGRNISNPAYPNVASYFTVKYVDSNHFTTATFFTNIDQDHVNLLANS